MKSPEKKGANPRDDKILIPEADCHMHLSSQEVNDQMREKIPQEMIPGDMELVGCDAADMISALDQAGITKAFALSNAYIWGMDIMQTGPKEYDMVRFENDFTANEVARFPDRLTAFFSINPLKDYAIREMDRCIDQLKMQGLKLHFTNSNVDLREPEHLERVKDVLTHAAQREVPGLFHFRSRSPDFGAQDVRIFVDQILVELPQLRVQMAHLGSWGGYDDLTADVFDAFIQAFEENPGLNKDNFFIDISAVLVKKSMGPIKLATPDQLLNLAEQLRRFGVEHVLWGSDWHAFDSGEYARAVQDKIPLSRGEFQTIFSNDGQGLFYG